VSDSRQAVQVADHRWLVKTACHECLIDIEWDRELPFVQVSLLSTHTGFWARGLGARVQQAWRVLRGDGAFFFETSSPEETDALINVLTLARTESWGLQAIPHGEAGATTTYTWQVSSHRATDAP